MWPRPIEFDVASAKIQTAEKYEIAKQREIHFGFAFAGTLLPILISSWGTIFRTPRVSR